MGRTRGRAGRRGAKRQQRRTVLLATNGALTEQSYLNELKQRLRGAGISLKVSVVPGEPESVLRKLRSPYGDTGGYDEVWIVVDEDDGDRGEFVRECQKLCTRKQSWFAVVSRPCFEVWLIAHFTAVRRYEGQRDAQRHYRSLVSDDLPEKELPRDFPFDAVGEASRRCHLPGDELPEVGELPPSPGTAMPHLVMKLGLL